MKLFNKKNLLLSAFLIGLMSPPPALAADTLIRNTVGDLLISTKTTDGGGIDIKSRQTGTGLFVNTSNNVGIATTTPSQKLTVSGAIHATGNISSDGSITGTINASQIASGIFGSVAGLGNYTMRDATGGRTVFFLDASNERVNIGSSTSPTATLSVTGSSTVSNALNVGSGNFYVSGGGNVGIGTASPGQKLTISAGNIAIDETKYLFLDGGSNTAIRSPVADEIDIVAGGQSRIYVNSNGNVGIGVSPTFRLDVNGNSSGNDGIIIANAGAGNPQVRWDYPIGTEKAAITFVESGSTLRINNAGDAITINSSQQVGFGTANPSTTITVAGTHNATQTTFTQGVTSAGILLTGNYVANGFTQGLFWKNSDDNQTKPKAGIYMKETGSGSYLYFGTSGNYSTGITNDALVIDYNGNVGITTSTLRSNTRMSVGTMAQGLNTPGHWLYAEVANSNWPFALDNIYDGSYVDHYATFNGYIDGGTRATPTFFGGGNGGTYIRRDGSGNPLFEIGSYAAGAGAARAPRVSIDSSGNVGIATASPLFTTQIAGALNTGDGAFLSQPSTARANYWDTDGTSNPFQPELMVRSDSTATTLNTTPSALVVYNSNGANNNWGKIGFVMNEATSNSNPVSIAGIAAEKTAGTAGGWASGDIVLWTKNGASAAEVMRGTSGGNIGIATTTPVYKLDVVGTGRFTQPVIVATPTASTQAATKGYVDAAIVSSSTPAGWTCTNRSGSAGSTSNAACTGSEKLITGGCTFSNDGHLASSYPSGQGWYCAAVSPANTQAFAQCCQ